MQIVSKLYDGRIDARNWLVEISVEDYLDLASPILAKNEFQRRRVRSSKTVYSLLRDDLRRGCIIPPIVLALTSHANDDFESDKYFSEYLKVNVDHLVILDGLQRTYTLIDVVDSLKSQGDEDALKSVMAHKIRVEIYVGINRLGILYRMLTLNTGQTPMSLRQQIEILYLDYALAPINGVQLVREASGQNASRDHHYKFSDIIEGFNSYLERNELPIDRADLLENIRSLEKLSKENANDDLFKSFVLSWDCFLTEATRLCRGASLSEDFGEEVGKPFGGSALQVFKKAQAIAGFGAAIGTLKDYGLVDGFDQVQETVPNLNVGDPQQFLEEINRSLVWIADNTKKIGNAQRSYFQYFFREVFNRESLSYMDMGASSRSALLKYQSQTL